jgi:hypothetical protein
MKNKIVSGLVTVLSYGIGFAIGFFLIGLVIGLFKEDKVTVPLGTNYNTEFKDNFMTGCMEEGTKEVCTCYYNSMLGQLGYDGLIDLASDYLKTEQIPTKLIDGIKKDCQ